MCKFLALENQTNYLLNKKESFQEKVQRAHILELENKKLEDSLIKKCEQHKSTKATKSHKLGELLKKLKTLDEITFLLEEKNKTNEDLMRKQNRMLREFKEKYKKTLKENQEIKNENEKLKTKVEELERNLEKISKENDQIKGITLHTKVSELGTEDLELNQSLSSDYEFFRNNLRPESRIRGNIFIKIYYIFYFSIS